MMWLLALGCSTPEPVVLPTSESPLSEPTATVPATPPARTYAGGWPVHPDRDALPKGDWDRAPRVGRLFPPFVGRDVHGEDVHLYDFAGTGPVVVDLSTMWCGICQELAGWIAGDPDTSFAPQSLVDAIDAGDVRWVTLLSEDLVGNPATADTVAAWHDAFPHPEVPVLLDDDAQVATWMRAYGYPRLILLDADLRIEAYDLGYDEVLWLAAP